MRMLVPLGHKGVQTLGQVIQVGKISDAQALALQNAEPLLMTPILMHLLSTDTDKWTG